MHQSHSEVKLDHFRAAEVWGHYTFVKIWHCWLNLLFIKAQLNPKMVILGYKA
jgi:hypothetical protein